MVFGDGQFNGAI